MGRIPMSTHGFRRWGRVSLAIFLVVVWSTSLCAGPLFDEGAALYGKKDYKKAAKVLKTSLDREEETDVSATLLLSECYIQVKKHTKAIEVLKEGASRHADNFEIHYRLGNLQEETGDLFGALSAFSRAFQLEPDDLTTVFRLGIVYDGTAQIEKALEMYRMLYRAGSPLAPKLLRAIQGMD
jgi:tetratricopeptide (TPR) repeat protein